MTTIPSADLNRAIAQLCGWRVHHDSVLGWQCINGKQRTPLRRTDVEAVRDLPNYSGSLDTCQEAEMQHYDLLVKRKYWLALLDISNAHKLPPVGHWQLNARQRAEALYAVLGRREGGS